MLYPRRAKSKVMVTLPSGQVIDGTLAYLDEFTVGLTDDSGVYRSWRTRDVRYKVDSPVDAHVELFSKYTDADIHNLAAYLALDHLQKLGHSRIVFIKGQDFSSDTEIRWRALHDAAKQLSIAIDEQLTVKLDADSPK